MAVCDMCSKTILHCFVADEELGTGYADSKLSAYVDKYGSEEDKQEVFDDYNFVTLMLIQGTLAFCHLSGINGAVTFTICPVLITILMHIVYAVLSAIAVANASP